MKAALAAVILSLAVSSAAIGCTLPQGGDAAVAEVIARTNAYRAKKNRTPLAISPGLSSAAQEHACWMAAQGKLSHAGDNGNSVGDRARAKGYRYRTIAENIALGQPDAAAVVSGWIGSRVHRRNIETRRLRDIGIGLSTRGTQRYWVMVLGAPR